jgi:hypothetical protein
LMRSPSSVVNPAIGIVVLRYPLPDVRSAESASSR